VPTLPEDFGAPEAGSVLILAPTGRDAVIVQILLGREHIDGRVCPTLQALGSGIGDDTGAVLIVDEAFVRADLSPLTEKIAAQSPWSDYPSSSSLVAGRQHAALLRSCICQRCSGRGDALRVFSHRIRSTQKGAAAAR
jgi:hypothetical protein